MSEEQSKAGTNPAKGVPGKQPGTGSSVDLSGEFPDMGLESKASFQDNIVAESSPKTSYLVWGAGLVVAVILTVVVAFTLATTDTSETPAPETLSADAREGKNLFEKYGCSSCHLADGRVAGTGPRLSTSKASDDQIRNYVRRGKGAMPSFGNLADAELNNIISYIHEIRTAATKTPAK
ncbi:MAG TPA: cytochrome c [Chloroflexia bacterium]|nr:cytochrome c [Chloroflexia bacterium]